MDRSPRTGGLVARSLGRSSSSALGPANAMLLAIGVALLVLAPLLILDERPHKERTALAFSAGLAVALVLLLLEGLTWMTVDEWPDLFRVSAYAGIAAGVCFSIFYFVGTWLTSYVYKPLRARKARLFPEEEIIESLVQAVITAEDGARSLTGGSTANLIVLIEWVSGVIERHLGRVPAGDLETQVWLRTETAQMAAGLREMKRRVLMPPDGRSDMAEALSGCLVHAAHGTWSSFVRAQAPPAMPRRQRVFETLRPLGVAVIPVAALVALTASGVSVPNGVASSVATLSVGSGVLGLIGRIDPNAQDRATNAAELIGRLSEVGKFGEVARSRKAADDRN